VIVGAKLSLLLVLESVLVLEKALELAQALESALVPVLELHKQTLSHQSMPLPLLKPISVFYSLLSPYKYFGFKVS